jgi:hypothetical protein
MMVGFLVGRKTRRQRIGDMFDDTFDTMSLNERLWTYATLCEELVAMGEPAPVPFIKRDIVAHKMFSELLEQDLAIKDRMKGLEQKWSIIRRRKRR